MRKIFFFLTPLLLFVPLPLWAADDLLTPTQQDLSMHYLSMIFGVVDGVLHGTGSQILGKMFSTFNSAILLMSAVIITYIFITSILNTAHEGEFLGRKWSSIWVPLRTVTGIGLLLPKASGYSMIQVLVMWVIVQGVGAADHLWKTTLDYLQQSGAVVQAEQNINGGSVDNSAFFTKVIAPIFKSEVCMLALQQAEAKQNQPQRVQVPNFAASLHIGNTSTGAPVNYAQDSSAAIFFPGTFQDTAFKDSLRGTCGRLQWNFIKPQQSGESAAQLAVGMSTALQQLAFSLLPLAQSVANRITDPNAQPVSSGDPMLFPVTRLVGASMTYFGIMKPLLNTGGGADAKYKSFIKRSGELGWVLAGSYYYQIAALSQSARKNNNAAADLSSNVEPQFNPNYAGDPFNSFKDNPTNKVVVEYIVNNLKSITSENGPIDQYAVKEAALSKQQSGNTDSGDSGYKFPGLSDVKTSGGGFGSAVNGIMGFIFNKLMSGTAEFQKKLSDAVGSGGMDPIFGLVTIGNSLVTQIETAWVGIFIGIIGLGLVNVGVGLAAGFWSVGLAVNIALAVITLLMSFLPLFTIWAGINFVLGCTLSYYIPLLPFILFLLGTITWFAAVLEAIIAAPLVALGITHPEGHDFLGKAEQATMLLASVFLRPILMIFGFIFGIILSYVAIELFNKGFVIAIQFLREYNGDFLVIVYQTAVMSVYTATTLAIISRSFSMIYEVPNKVLRWIGGPTESGGEESIMQQISGQQKQDVGAIAQKAPSGESGVQASKLGADIGKGIAELKKSKTTAK